MEIAWGNAAVNMQHAEQMMESQKDVDLFVLPEMFTSGFCMNPNKIADRKGDVLNWMKKMSQKHNAAIAGSVAIVDDEHYFNRFYFVHPNGDYDAYDKRHLFSFAGEDKCYTPGDKRTIVVYKGWRILLQVCYDLRFPVWSRNHKEYDLMIYVANWPESRIEAWKTLLKARAIENQCYVIGVNRVGEDPKVKYSGCSRVIDAYGRVMINCATDEECRFSTELNMEELLQFRKKFPVLEDAD
jgi:predicted amidohydrolase